MKRNNTEHGFTLTELLVVLVIIGVLVLLAVPRFSSVVAKTKTTEAKLMLKQVYVLQEAYWDENDTYGKSLDAIGFRQEKLVTDGGDARYQIELTEATDTSFTAIATAVVDIYRDSEMDQWSINQRKELFEL